MATNFPLHRAIKKILDDPNSRPELPGLEPEKPKDAFPWDLFSPLPDEWMGAASSAARAASSAAPRASVEHTQLEVAISSSPALAVFQDKLYCIHEGFGNDGWLWVTTYDGKTWSKDVRLEKEGKKHLGTTGAPALVVYDGKLHCMREGQSGTGVLWHATFDGVSWSNDQSTGLDGGTSRRGFAPAALAVYRGTLYCVHEGKHGSNELFYSTFDKATGKWSKHESVGAGTTAGCSLLVMNDYLYCLHEGHQKHKDGAGLLWSTHFDGKVWSEDEKVEKARGIDARGISAMGDDLYLGITGPPTLFEYRPDSFFIMHQGPNEDNLLWSIGKNREHRTVVLAGTNHVVGLAYAPALASFDNSDLLHLLHAGGKTDTVGKESLWHAYTKNPLIVPIQEYDLRLPDARPGAPYPGLDRYNPSLTEHIPFISDAFPVEMTRHHIIPDNRLRDFWNRMLETNHIHIAAEEFLGALDENLERYEMTLRANDILQLRELMLGIRNGTIRHNPNARPADGIDNLATAIRWLPGNIFIGPTAGRERFRRSDDPGDSFEENANTVTGRDFGAEFIHRNANNALEGYMRTGDTNSARRALSILARIAAVRVEPYAVDPLDWGFRHNRYRLHERGD
ncbi:exo-alpha-sialidase [Leptolyngbya sp. NIES-2104]|uniref:exo-alpha-sialidase n=1 Tax=Leptolyngbya sp. NIES-2104 TaxID=1552121 RepID=UPI0006EC5185|nr:exo-alpha-sialidase [Leptolyngbya sp. NIES-2104]GAP94273.1 cell surface protein [Leptolyngbya sp. NIES-2104]